MRCPDCNKFVSYDEPQIEISSVDSDGTCVRSIVTVQLNCQDCGTTLKDSEIESEMEIDHECNPDTAKSHQKDHPFSEGDDQFEIENEGNAQGETRTETKDRHGKEIKSSRYMKTFYGFTLDTDVKCNKCGEIFTVTTSGEEQASSFNECC